MPYYMKVIIIVETVLVLIGIMFLWFASPSHAQSSMMTISVCNDTPTMLKLLTDKYHEVAIGGGINKRGEHTRLYVSPNSWTILVTRADGISCLAQVSGEVGEWVVAPPHINGEPL